MVFYSKCPALLSIKGFITFFGEVSQRAYGRPARQTPNLKHHKDDHVTAPHPYQPIPPVYVRVPSDVYRTQPTYNLMADGPRVGIPKEAFGHYRNHSLVIIMAVLPGRCAMVLEQIQENHSCLTEVCHGAGADSDAQM